MNETTFDDLVRSTDPAMVVVTAAHDDALAGCLVGFHSQCSIGPARYAVWLSKANLTFRVASLASHLAVHFLTADDLDVARLFGTVTGDDVDKFAVCGWVGAPHGSPLLQRCPNRFEARKVAMVDDGGDHALFVVEPTSGTATGSDRSLRLCAVEHFQPGHDHDDDPESVPANGD